METTTILLIGIGVNILLNVGGLLQMVRRFGALERTVEVHDEEISRLRDGVYPRVR